MYLVWVHFLTWMSSRFKKTFYKFLSLFTLSRLLWIGRCQSIFLTNFRLRVFWRNTNLTCKTWLFYYYHIWGYQIWGRRLIFITISEDPCIRPNVQFFIVSKFCVTCHLALRVIFSNWQEPNEIEQKLDHTLTRAQKTSNKCTPKSQPVTADHHRHSPTRKENL